MAPVDSDLAQQATRDPYVFDFVAMTDRRNERELELQLVQHVEKFLLPEELASSLPSIELLEAELADERANAASTGRGAAVEPERNP